MKVKKNKLKALLLITMSAFIITSCTDGAEMSGGLQGTYNSSDKGLTYSGWKLVSIEPNFANTEDSSGFDIRFYDMGQCSGKGNINTFYSEHYSYYKPFSKMTIKFDYVSNNGDGGKVEQKYFEYLEKAQFYEFQGDSIMKIYPYAQTKRIYLKFKNIYGFYSDDHK
ncbi:MAG: hypothetical protein IJ213_08180 [Bacteroidales bacterium]|nr:hypothetical protein [Bacteroidales bacterium]MBQ9313004.1 hypothetical protein [Bacteroidales bacterium]